MRAAFGYEVAFCVTCSVCGESFLDRHKISSGGEAPVDVEITCRLNGDR